MLMFAKVWLMSFVYDIIDAFCVPTTVALDIYKQNRIIKYLIILNLTDTDSCSFSFVFVCDLASKNFRKDVQVMSFEACAERIMNLREYQQGDKKPKKIIQRRFQLKNAEMKMEAEREEMRRES